MEAFFAQRLADLRRGARLARRDRRRRTCFRWWTSGASGCTRLRRLFHEIGGDIVAALRALEQRGRLETIASAATHGFLPLLARDESIRLQLAVGRAEHRRLFGRDARRASGCPSAPTGRAGPGSRGATRAARRHPPRDRGARERRRLPLLLRGLAPRVRGPSARHLRRSRRRSDAAPARRERRRHRAPLALRRLPGRARAGRGGHRRAGAGPPLVDAGVEPVPGLSRATGRISSSTRCAGPAASSSGG